MSKILFVMVSYSLQPHWEGPYDWLRLDILESNINFET